MTNEVLGLAAKVPEVPAFCSLQRKQRYETETSSKANLGGDEVRLLILSLTGSTQRLDTVSAAEASGWGWG